MGKLIVFNFTTLNGLFKGPNEDISWHRHGTEENEYSGDMLKQESALVFGRVTYELMASYWPTLLAHQNDPVTARGMNRAEKLVFSKTLKETIWENSRLVGGDLVKAIGKLKNSLGKNLVILGSGSIVTQCADSRIIDEYQIMVDPVIMGEGTSMFWGLKNKLDLKLIGTRVFKSGNLLLRYVPL